MWHLTTLPFIFTHKTLGILISKAWSFLTRDTTNVTVYEKYFMNLAIICFIYSIQVGRVKDVMNPCEFKMKEKICIKDWNFETVIFVIFWPEQSVRVNTQWLRASPLQHRLCDPQSSDNLIPRCCSGHFNMCLSCVHVLSSNSSCVMILKVISLKINQTAALVCIDSWHC